MCYYNLKFLEEIFFPPSRTAKNPILELNWINNKIVHLC